MTRKRYQKLFRSEITKLMKGKELAGRCIQAASKAKPVDFFGGQYSLYKEAWDAVRACFITDNNIPPIS